MHRSRFSLPTPVDRDVMQLQYVAFSVGKHKPWLLSKIEKTHCFHALASGGSLLLPI